MIQQLQAKQQAALWCAAGQMLLAQYLPQRQALIVLDDVDDADSQLDKLLPKTGLHLNSIVIITSRQRRLLELRCSLIHDVQLLTEELAMQLFTAVAFPAGVAPSGVAAQVPAVVASCGGLPLTIKVRSLCVLEQCQ